MHGALSCVPAAHHQKATSKNTPTKHRLFCRRVCLVGEAVNRFGVVGFSGLGDGLRPFGMVDGIGIVLGFQGDAAALAVYGAALSGLVQEIAGIELNAGQVGVDRHGAPGNGIGKHRAGIAEDLEVVVIAALQIQRLIIGPDVLSDGLGAPEIHGRAFHAAHFAGGDAFVIGNGKHPGRQHQQLIHGSAGVIVTGKIKIAVVGQVEDGVLVADGIIGDVQSAGGIEHVGHVDGSVAGEALIAVGAV